MKQFIQFSPGKILLAVFTVFGALAATRAYPQAAPAISNINPNSGLVGTSLMISGTNFNATAASNIVYFGAVQATVLSASANSLTVAVPSGATYAPITVTVNGLTADASAPFLPTFAGNGAAIDGSTFTAGFTLPTASGPARVVMADLDGDGRPDLVVNDGSAGVFSIYQNIGINGVLNAGTFAAPITFSVASNSGPVGLVAADLNGDGKLDLVLSDRNNNQIAVFQNVSSAGMLTTNSFAAPVYFAVGADPRTVAVSDLDGDGLPDIVCVNNGSGTVSILRNTGATGPITTNSFAARVDLPMAGNGEGLAVGDLDGDGKPDIAVTDSTGFVSVFRNKCTPGNISPATFDTRLDLAAQNDTIGVAIGDLDGDGKAELISTAYLPQTMSVYRNLSSPGTLTTNSFAAPVDYALAGRGHNIALSDFNGDGKLDIAIVTELDSALSLFQNIGAGGFTSNSLAPRVDFSTGWNAWGIAVGDLDGDGRPDIVFCNAYDSNIQIYQNQAPFGTPPSCIPAPSGLVGWWKGEGNANDSAGTNNGSLSGSGATYATGEVGQGFRFDGTNGYVQIPDSDALKPTNVTLEAWVWLDPNLPANNGGEDIVFKQNTWSAWFEAYCLMKNTIDNGNGTFSDRFQFVVSRYGNQVIIDSQTIAQRGVWYHVAATYDGNQSILYVNGVAEASATPGFPLDYGTNPVFIGTSGTWPPYLAMFGGIIDEVSIYNRALSSNEIAVIYNAGSAGKCAPAVAACVTPPVGLVGWWKGDGNTIDSIGGNNGLNQNITYTNGVVGQAFACDPENYLYGTYTGIQIADQPAYALTNSLTIEGWIRPRGDGYNIFWRGDNRPGLDPYFLGMSANSNINLWITDQNGSSAAVGTTIPYYVWTHVTATLDGSSGTMSLYTNGVLAAQTITTIRPFGALIPGASPGVGIGNVNDGQNNFPFVGDIDEISLYNRALTTGEIQAIYSAGSAGKCYAPTAPFITSQPTNQTVTVNNPVTFTVTAGGTPPLNYQWSFNGTNIFGATNSSLTLDNVSPAQAGNYSVLVTNFFGAVTSSNAVLTVYVPPTPPVIVAQTPNQVVLAGSAATFSVTASGSDPLSYFWNRNDALIPGATNSFYILANAQLSDSGSKFSCLVTNAYGTAASTNVSLKVIDTISNDLCSGAVVITSYPYTNAQSTFNASSYGDPVPDCIDGFGNGVWYQFTPPVDGQLVVDTFGSDFDTGLAVYTGDCGDLTEVACNDDTGGINSQVILPATAGVTYRFLVGGYSAHVGNLIFHLDFLTAPAFITQPASQTVLAGSNATFNATLTGALPMSFQWFFNGTPLANDGRISGSATASLSIANITTADAGSYTLAVTNFLGATNSTAAVLTVLFPPAFTTEPVGRSVPPGLPTTFNVVATGNPPPSYYQWQLNGTNLPGATSASYTVAAVGTNDLGFYHVVASNSVGGATSADAQLTFGPVAAWGRNISNESLPPPGLSNVIGVAGGIATGFAVKSDGTVVYWGSSNGTNVPAGTTNVIAVSATGVFGNNALRSDGAVVGWAGSLPPAVSNIVSIASGFNFSLALRAEGTVVGWGNQLFSTVPAGLNHVVAISAGFSHALALRSDGTVIAWGTGTATNVPVGLTNVTAIAAGYAHSLALKANGTVVAWGSGTGTNLPAGLTNIVAISAENAVPNSLSLALRVNGTVVAWGDSPNGETNLPPGLSNLLSVAIAAAPNHGLALVDDGSPVILHPPVGLTGYTGRDVSLQASAAGAQPLSYQWLLNGTNVSGATNASLVIPNIQFANAGSYQLFVSNSINTAISLPAPVNVISNNTLVFLSQTTNSVTNYQGSKITAGGVTVLGSGPLRYQWFSSPTNRNYVAVSGATNDTLVLDPALAVQSGNYYVSVSNLVTGITSAPVNVKVLFARAWGFQAVSNPPVNVTNAIAVATGGYQNYYGDYFALGADGKLTAWANYTPIYGETNVSALSNSFVTAIAAGTQHSLALKSDGTVYAWGYGGYGQTNPPAGLNSVVAIACGGYHDLALKADGTVVGWGAAPQFNFGQATNNPAATNVVAIAAGAQHSLALRADGSVVAWGYNLDGSITVPPTATSVVAIAAGSGFSAALRANGTVVQWGTGLPNYPVPSNLSNVVAISASATHCTALRNDGTVVSWGYEYTGPAPSNVPPDLANVIAIASGGDHDFGLLGTRAPAFTVQPWNRSFASTARTNIVLAAKCAGVQPVSYQWQLNGTNVLGATNDVLILTNQPSLQFGPVRFIPTGAYQLIASNAYGVVASKFAKITTFYPLGDALDATNLNWTTTGNAQWFGQTNVTHDGVDAARSGGIGASQETILQTTLATNYPGNVTFWWKVSSEQFFDILEFRVNGVSQTNISGEVDWKQVSIPVAAGTNVLQWRYSKDATFDSGLDAAFVDQFAFAPGPPVITAQSASQIARLNSTVTFSVTATGVGPMTITWFRTNSAVPYVQNIFQMNTYYGSGPVFYDSFALSNVCRTNNGVYSVSVSNAGGTAYGTNVTLKVLVPQRLGSPVLLPDGSLQLTSSDVNGGTLSLSDLANFEAQASTDLMNWVTLTNALSLANGMLQLQDNTGTNWPTRFYRILEH